MTMCGAAYERNGGMRATKTETKLIAVIKSQSIINFISNMNMLLIQNPNS